MNEHRNIEVVVAEHRRDMGQMHPNLVPCCHHTPNEVRLLSTIGFLVGAEIERARLETENAALAGRLETRKVVDRAKGILQRDLSVTEDEAYRRMQRESRQRRKSMREIAEAILLGDDLKKSRQDVDEKPA